MGVELVTWGGHLCLLACLHPVEVQDYAQKMGTSCFPRVKSLVKQLVVRDSNHSITGGRPVVGMLFTKRNRFPSCRMSSETMVWRKTCHDSQPCHVSIIRSHAHIDLPRLSLHGPLRRIQRSVTSVGRTQSVPGGGDRQE